jgi:FkbM family methyltransferase
MKINDYIQKTRNTLQKQGIVAVLTKTGTHLKRVVRQRTFKPYTIQKVVEGEDISFYIGDVIGEEWYPALKERVPEQAWLKSHIRKGDFVADCGAHHGMISILCSKWVGPQGRVVAFEALPTNADIVRRNKELNHADNLEVRQQAVGREPGSIRFTLDSNASVARVDEKHSIEVPIINLDAAFLDQSPDFIKIDVEGHEIEVLKGAQRVMSSAPAFNIEVHCIMYDSPLDRVRELIDLLDLSRYITWIQLEYYDDPIPYDASVHTPEFIIGYDKVNLFAVSKHRDA